MREQFDELKEGLHFRENVTKSAQLKETRKKATHIGNQPISKMKAPVETKETPIVPLPERRSSIE